MKLRLTESGVTARVDEDEIQKLYDLKSISHKLTLNGGMAFTFSLKIEDMKKTLEVFFADGNLSVCMPEIYVKEWLEEGNTGFSAVQSYADGQSLSIIVEKDLKPKYQKKKGEEKK